MTHVARAVTGVQTEARVSESGCQTAAEHVSAEVQVGTLRVLPTLHLVVIKSTLLQRFRYTPQGVHHQDRGYFLESTLFVLAHQE